MANKRLPGLVLLALCICVSCHRHTGTTPSGEPVIRAVDLSRFPILPGDDVTISAHTIGSGDLHWEWSFEASGFLPSVSTSTSPVLRALRPGEFTGNVAVTNALGADSESFAMPVSSPAVPAWQTQQWGDPGKFEYTPALAVTSAALVLCYQQSDFPPGQDYEFRVSAVAIENLRDPSAWIDYALDPGGGALGQLHTNNGQLLCTFDSNPLNRPPDTGRAIALALGEVPDSLEDWNISFLPKTFGGNPQEVIFRDHLLIARTSDAGFGVSGQLVKSIKLTPSGVTGDVNEIQLPNFQAKPKQIMRSFPDGVFLAYSSSLFTQPEQSGAYFLTKPDGDFGLQHLAVPDFEPNSYGTFITGIGEWNDGVVVSYFKRDTREQFLATSPVRNPRAGDWNPGQPLSIGLRGEPQIWGNREVWMTTQETVAGLARSVQVPRGDATAFQFGEIMELGDITFGFLFYEGAIAAAGDQLVVAYIEPPPQPLAAPRRLHIAVSEGPW